ncbi:MAG TPA: hypothetical protein VFW96_02710, partial [Thermomicrobiales bacterium]|nr:hypothetical protein [Thermomicrobiales bacterium]
MDEAEALALAAGDGALAAHARFQRGRFRCMRGERRRGLAEMEGELAALDALPRDHRLRSSEDVALVALGALFSDSQAPVPPAELPLSFPLAFLAHHLALAGRYRAALALSERLAAARADPGGTPHRGMTP